MPFTDTIHTIENIPSVPPGMPSTDPTLPKVALDENQLAWALKQPGEIMPTIRKYWALLVFLAGAIIAADKSLTPYFTQPVAQLAQPVAQPDLSKENASLKKDRDDLLDVATKQKKMIDTLMKKG